MSNFEHDRKNKHAFAIAILINSLFIFTMLYPLCQALWDIHSRLRHYLQYDAFYSTCAIILQFTVLFLLIYSPIFETVILGWIVSFHNVIVPFHWNVVRFLNTHIKKCHE